MKRTGIMVLGGLLVYGGLAGLAYGQGGTDVTVTVPNEKYAAFIVPEPGAKLKLTIQSGSQPLTSSKIMPEDTSDLALWSPGSHAGPGPHVYESGPVLSSREWLRISGNIAGNVGAGGGSGAKGFDVDVPAVDIDIEGVTEEKEEAEGGYVGVGTNGLRKVTISKVQAETRFRGKVKLTVVNGARIRLWEEPQRIHEITTFPKEYATPSALPKDLWVEGVTASASKGDVVLTASYTTPTENKTTQDKVKITVIKVEIKAEDGTSDPREYVDADTEVDPSYNTVKYKAVVTPTVSGTFTWSTTSSKITLTDASSQTVTVNAGANASSAVDAEEVKVQFTPGGASTGCEATHDLTVVHCTYTAYSDKTVVSDVNIGHGWWRFGIEPADATTLIQPPNVRIWANQDAGYFPASVGSPHGPGQLRMGDQGHTPTSQHPWDIPFILIDNGLTYCRDLAASPGTYDLFVNNCCHKVISSSCTCGVNIPNDKDTPTKLHDYLSGL